MGHRERKLFEGSSFDEKGVLILCGFHFSFV